MIKIGIGGNFISSHHTMKLFRDPYHTSTIFPRLSIEKLQELKQSDAMKFPRERSLDFMNLSNYPVDQLKMLKKGKYLISHDHMELQ